MPYYFYRFLLLIALVTMSAVKISAISIGFLLVSLVTNRVSLEEECLPSFEVLNCLLNLSASCVDDENEIPLKEIASFSAVRFALPSIPLIVLHSLVISVLWSMFSNKSLHFCSLCSQMRFWMSLFSLGNSGEVRSFLRRSSRLVITSSISAGTGSCCCLPTPMTLASGGSPMFPLVVHQPASPSIWPAVRSLRRGLSTNPGATMWCVCGCS